MNVVTFFNFTNEDFTGMWNGVPDVIKAGEKRPMESWRAEHYATHLVNRELFKEGNEKDTSPKDKERNPRFMEIFSKCVLGGSVEVPAENIDMAVAQARAVVEKPTKKAIKKTSEEEFAGLKE